jgi:hypothetical protein
MATNEHKDIALRHLLDQQTERWRDFQESLDQLIAIAHDFGPGSQQRWMLAMRECSARRDELWETQQQIDQMGEE